MTADSGVPEPPLMFRPHDAGLLVERFQNLVPAWSHVSRNDVGIVRIVLGEIVLPVWYEGELKGLLAHAGVGPMHLPLLADFLGAARRRTDTPEYFTPSQAMAHLIWWARTLWEEDKQLLLMEASLRGGKKCWQRENLFVLWQVLHSASPAAIAEREEHRLGLHTAQLESARALDQLEPELGDTYCRCSDAYHEAEEMIQWIDRAKAISWSQEEGEKYNPQLVRDSYEEAHQYHRYWSYQFFEQAWIWPVPDGSGRFWLKRYDGWRDPAHQEWLPRDGISDGSWDERFANKLINAERPNVDSNGS